jgi:hypothetical protein
VDEFNAILPQPENDAMIGSSRRIQIRWMMILVALVAIDCAMVRSPLAGRPLDSILLILGALPMANVLAIGLVSLVRQSSSRTHRSMLIRFEFAGCAILVIFALLATHQAEGIRELLSRILIALRFGPPMTLPAASVILALPQIMLALLVARLVPELRPRVGPCEELA